MFIYIINMNNNQLSFPKASPNKSGVSDGTSTFEMGRRTYMNIFSKIQPVQNLNAKKWIGGNNDASSITEKRRNKEIGKGTLNLNINDVPQTLSYSNGDDLNLIQRRRMFTRSGGYVVPPKCRGYI